MEIVDVTQPFVALKGATSELTLYCYEKLKQDLGFDPEAQVKLPKIAALMGPWPHHEEFPPSITEQVKDLNEKMLAAGTIEDIVDYMNQQEALLRFMALEERRDDDADEPAQ